jgi:hypothetical protein
MWAGSQGFACLGIGTELVQENAACTLPPGIYDISAGYK